MRMRVRGMCVELYAQILLFPLPGVLWAFQHVKKTIVVCNLKGRTSPRGNIHSNQFNFDLSTSATTKDKYSLRAAKIVLRRAGTSFPVWSCKAVTLLGNHF